MRTETSRQRDIAPDGQRPAELGEISQGDFKHYHDKHLVAYPGRHARVEWHVREVAHDEEALRVDQSEDHKLYQPVEPAGRTVTIDTPQGIRVSENSPTTKLYNSSVLPINYKFHDFFFKLKRL